MRPEIAKRLLDAHAACRAIESFTAGISDTPLAGLRMLGVAGDLIGRVRGRRFVFDSDALDKLVGNAWFTSEKAQTELDYRPKRGLRETIPAMVKKSAER